MLECWFGYSVKPEFIVPLDLEEYFGEGDEAVDDDEVSTEL
jgi:hypothetical protein